MAKKKNGNGKSNGHSNGNGIASRNKSLLGHNAIFTPEVMDDIHIKAELGRYRMRGMALMIKIPTLLSLSNEDHLIQQVVLAIGAGIYEEFVFRDLLISGLAILFGLIFNWGEFGKIFLSVIISSAIFSSR